MISWFKNSVYYRSFNGLSREIWLLSLVMLINRSGAMVLPFLSIYLNQELHFGLKECGLIMTSFGVGSVIGAFVGGILTDRIGFFKVMFFSLILTALSFYAVMNLSSFYGLCLGFFLISLIADTFRPANLTAIEAFSLPENRTRSLSLIRLAINLGYAIGPFMGGYVASLIGYNFLFVINGTTILTGGIFFFFLFRHRKQSVLTREEQARLVNPAEVPWHDRQYLVYLILFLVSIVVFFQLLYTIPLFFKTKFAFDESQIGMLMALNGLIIAIIEMPLIFKLENKFSARFFVILGGVLIGLAYLCLLIPSNYLVVALMFTLFITVGEVFSFPFSNTYALVFSKDHNRGKYMGLYTMTFSVAHIIAPITGLYIADLYGFDMLYTGSAIVCILASLMIIRTKMRKAQVR